MLFRELNDSKIQFYIPTKIAIFIKQNRIQLHIPMKIGIFSVENFKLM